MPDEKRDELFGERSIAVVPLLLDVGDGVVDGGMKANDAKRLKELEIENRRLKKAVADLTLDKQILEEAAKGSW